MKSLEILILALVFDLMFGEPPERIHPTVLIGSFASFLKRKVKGKLGGCVLALMTLIIFVFPTYFLLEFLKPFEIAYIFIASFLFKTTFAIKSMKKHVVPIRKALSQNSIEEAKKQLSKVVRRRTEKLDEEHIISAAVETVAEGTVDGITSPLFYFALFGIPGSLAYRVVNTLDSILGYKDEEHKDVGWFSAKLDTLMNFIPARITALIILLTSLPFSKSLMNGWKVLRKDRKKTESVNAGWPMSAMAGILGVRLEKLNHYSLGNGEEKLEKEHISKALNIMYITTILFVLLIVVPILFIRWMLW